jgi:membrane-associated phospholipid phosphatase
MIRPFARRSPVQPAEAAEPGNSAAESAAIAGLPQGRPPLVAVSRTTAVIVSIAAGLTFALLTVWLARRGSSAPGVDENIHSWVISHRSPVSISIARAVTWAGVTTIVLPALLAVGAVTGWAGRGIGGRLGSGFLLSLVASAGVFTEIRINALVGRARPPAADWAGAAGGPAFPSGHTTAATLFAASCAWVLATRVRAGWPRRAVWAGAAVYAAAVGWSRVWLGVHWPTDVIGGWLFGVAWIGGSVAVILTLRRRYAGRRAGFGGG